MSTPARKKSPRAPSMPLDEAVERTAKAYGRDRMHAAPTDVMAQHMGYKSANNGAALQALASLRYYGLLERPAEGMLAVSKSYESYHFAPDESLQRRLAVGWLRTPPIFAELLDKYANGLPSDATLRHELVTQRGFMPAAAETLIGVLKKSAQFVRYFEQPIEGVVPVAEVPSDTEPEPTAELSSMPSEALRSRTPSAFDSSKDEPDVIDRIPVRLRGGRRAWLLIPTPFFEADKARLKAQIDLLLGDDDPADDGLMSAS